ncbi:MAG: lipopolysaccharide heptosyltransferase II [Candidatus Makaraimicrobium thalassicum]|nr:MAG: lipopolysaccharide heptosyltransferase II [Candidatus Omnitrophota bacterium]
MILLLPGMGKNIRNIVVFRTDRIGEVLLSSVAVEAIKSSYPGTDVSFVTSEYSRPLLEGRADIKKIITVDTFEKGNWLFKAFRLALLLRKGRFDAAVVLNPHKTLHLACFLAGIPVRAGYDRKWGFLLNKKMRDERGKGEKHEIEYTMDLLRLVGIDRAAQAPSLSVGSKAESTVADLMAEKNVNEDIPLIAVHPGSSNPVKMWPHERYAELIRRIKADMDCNVAIIGDRREGILAWKIIRETGADVLDLTGALDLKELAAFLARSVLFIGSDTGPMHMAAAMGIPVIAIFGRNIPGVSPVRWRPWGEKHVVFHENPGCVPCHDTACPYDYRCLRAVTVDAVFEAARRIVTHD